MKLRSQSYQAIADTDAELIDVLQYIDLVHRIAWHMHSRMPSSVVIDDLIQAGVVGLIEASHSYDPSRAANFKTWAGIRIRGAILDEVRRGDWIPRSVYKKGRLVANAIDVLVNNLGRQPTEDEICATLDLSLDEYHSWLLDFQGIQLLPLEGDEDCEVPTHDSVSPQSVAEKKDMQSKISAAIGQLNENEKLMLSLYYENELTFKEVGAILGVTESRVSQIHNQAIIKIRSMLEK